MTRIRRRYRLALAVATVLVVPQPSRAQVLTGSTIEGRVYSEAGEPLRDARVLAVSEGTGVRREVRSDADGRFTLRFVPAGEYELLIELLGYAPRRILEVPARPSSPVVVDATLRSVSGPAEQVDEQVFVAGKAGSRAGGEWFDRSRIDALPHADRSPAELARLSSLADDELGVEGLPASLSALRFEGIDWRPTSLSGAWPAVPLLAFRAAELTMNGIDVELGGAAGGVLSGHVATGANSAALAARGSWTGDALPAAIEPDDGWTDVRAEARVRGPLAGGRGGFGIGIDARLLGLPRSAAWAGADAEAVVAADAAPAELADYLEPAVQEGTLVRGFGALDAPIATQHAVGARVLLNRASLEALPGSVAGASGADALDLLGTMFLASAASERWWNHAQVGVTHSNLERDPLAFAPLVLAQPGLETTRRLDARSRQQTVITVQNVLGTSVGPHELKAGVGVRHARYSYDHLLDADGVYSYGGLDELIAGTGALLRTEPVVDEAEWSSTGIGVFAQDRWRPLAGLEVLVGVRVDAEPLPREEVTLDGEWLRLTGITNRVLESQPLLLSPRAAATWYPDRARRWRLAVATGVYQDRYDPNLLAVWQADAGTARVRRGAGAVSWPDGTIGGPMALRLTLLDQEFAPPRTSRLTAAVARTIGTGTTIQLAGSVRRTDNLPRRVDLNLTDDPVAQDQYGRTVYGTLVKQGGLLVEEPGTSRRFIEYDEVAAINADGESEYRAVTVAVDHTGPGLLDVFARYTYSRTTDDWPGARAGGWLRAAPPDLAGWADGTSDLDVPHRAVVGAVIGLPFGLTLGGVYRAQSGRPFTPGFRVGVDANADGVAGNDPAFLDSSLPGMSDLVARWSCLGGGMGDVAERNACRGPVVHALDATAALRLFTAAGVAASVRIEAYDLLEAERRAPDSALYLIDPEAPLDTADGTVVVPLVVNPDFGQPRAVPVPGRMLRIGLSLNW